MTKALVLEDSETVRQWLRQQLSGRFSLDEAASLDEARGLLNTTNYDCLLFDFELPDGDSSSLIRSLRDRGANQQTPLLVLTSSTKPSLIREVYEVGADDFMRKPLCPEELEARISHVLQRRREACAAEYDPLTGAYNRRTLSVHAERLMSEADRLKLPFSVLLFDVDEFKAVNDHYGHLKGDQLLTDLVSVVKSQLRPYDLVFRFGGDEFLILLPATDPEQAMVVANKLVKHVGDYAFDSLTAQISVGASAYSVGESFEVLIDRCDKALYTAKEAGKNGAHYLSKEQHNEL